MKVFQPTAACHECGGACCRSNPGPTTPEDFDCDQAHMAQALASGDWIIDKMHNLFIRPNGELSMFQILFTGDRGRCVFLGNDGCRLHQRPTFCQSLEPGDDKCIQHGTYRDLRDAWAPWQPLLEQWRKEIEKC